MNNIKNLPISSKPKPQQPVYITKMLQNIEKMETTLEKQKQFLYDTEKEFTKFKKAAFIFVEHVKKMNEKVPRKPSGFVLPVLISNELCDFLNEPYGTHKSRTEVTKYIIKYIDEHKLVNPNKKTQIVPDEKLMKLLYSDEVQLSEIQNLTRFTLQKYMNKHFISMKK